MGWRDTQKSGLVLGQLGVGGEGRSQRLPLGSWLSSREDLDDSQGAEDGSRRSRERRKFNIIELEVLRGSRTKPI